VNNKQHFVCINAYAKVSYFQRYVLVTFTKNKTPMKPFFILILASILCTSCTTRKKEPFTSVSISEIFTDSLSIRAIVPQDASRIWFAANKGVVGLIEGTIPKLATVQYDNIPMHFRAIAKTTESVFVLSIDTPAVLYKIDLKDNEASAMEEVYVETGVGVFYDAISFWNDQEGIAMGDPIGGCLSIIITRDGGNSWSKLSCDTLPAVVKGEAAFAASNSNIAMYGDDTWIVTGGMRARVFHSPDKGFSWSVYDTPMLQGGVMTGIYSVAFLDASTGVIVGGNWDDKNFNEGNKAITKDGGKTWNLLSNGAGPGYRSSVSFVPGTQGQGLVAVGSPGISYSSDQGTTWTELSTEGFYAISFVNDSVAFASGNMKISKIIFH
jgi:photosystem II stability/assembly factor-like uncharacterized protein